MGLKLSASCLCSREERSPPLVVSSSNNNSSSSHNSKRKRNRSNSSSSNNNDNNDNNSGGGGIQRSCSLTEKRKARRHPQRFPCVALGSNGHITMATEDLLQPGHVVKERWKVVRKYNSWPLSLFLSLSLSFSPNFSFGLLQCVRLITGVMCHRPVDDWPFDSIEWAANPLSGAIDWI